MEEGQKKKKNSFKDVDRLIFQIRKCAVENGDKCGPGFCRCEQLKEELMELFNPTFYHLIEFHAMYPCYTHKDDFEQEIKTRFLELIYDWNDERGIYFVTYASIMLHRWVQKINNKLYDWTRRRVEDYKLFDIEHHDRSLDKEIECFVSNDKVDKMLENLTHKQREAVKCRYVDSFMVNEIANRFEVSPGAVSNLLKRAYKTLREDELHDRAGGNGSEPPKKKRRTRKKKIAEKKKI